MDLGYPIPLYAWRISVVALAAILWGCPGPCGKGDAPPPVRETWLVPVTLSELIAAQDGNFCLTSSGCEALCGGSGVSEVHGCWVDGEGCISSDARATEDSGDTGSGHVIIECDVTSLGVVSCQ